MYLPISSSRIILMFYILAYEYLHLSDSYLIISKPSITYGAAWVCFKEKLVFC